MNIGAAIVTFNNAADITACVESLRSEGVQSIAIVDSGSSDGTLEQIKSIGCVYKQSPLNKGFGYSANQASALLNTEYVLFVNPDTRIQSGAIHHIAETMKRNVNAGIVGMLLCDEFGKPERMAFGDEPTIIKMITRRMFRKEIRAVPFSVDWVSGGAFVMSRKLFAEIGGFDDQFFMYWEDVDLCKRVREKGYVVVMSPLSKVTHTRGGSNMGQTEKEKIYTTSADRYFKKHYATTIWYLQRFLRKLYSLRSALR